tara:strand:+ start:143 stop:295 length:153 start_codon:yes stop_codon:yes gene_type:complete
MSELKNYNDFVNKKLLILYDKLFFPFLKYIDLIGGRFIGKNIFVVAKLSK